MPASIPSSQKICPISSSPHTSPGSPTTAAGNPVTVVTVTSRGCRTSKSENCYSSIARAWYSWLWHGQWKFEVWQSRISIAVAGTPAKNRHSRKSSRRRAGPVCAKKKEDRTQATKLQKNHCTWQEKNSNDQLTKLAARFFLNEILNIHVWVLAADLGCPPELSHRIFGKGGVPDKTQKMTVLNASELKAFSGPSYNFALVSESKLNRMPWLFQCQLWKLVVRLSVYIIRFIPYAGIFYRMNWTCGICERNPQQAAISIHEGVKVSIDFLWPWGCGGWLRN